MNPHQQERSAAARAFDESIDQLHATLQATDGLPEEPRSSQSAPASFDLSSFEQAVADIEQFIQTRADRASGDQTL